MAGDVSVRLVFRSQGFREVLNEPGVAHAVHEQAVRIGGGVSSADVNVSDFTMRGGSRVASAVHTKAKSGQEAYESRRELAASVR